MSASSSSSASRLNVARVLIRKRSSRRTPGRISKRMPLPSRFRGLGGEDRYDRAEVTDEPRGLGAEVVAPGDRDAIVLGAPPVLGHAPLAGDVPAVLQAVKC